MNIVVIHGSMRKGNTYALTQKIMKRLASNQDIAFTEFCVADLNLPFCVSCHMCFNKGEEFCIHYDRLQDLTKALQSCDGVILSGTTYMWALNGAMKNLIDHFAYKIHRPELFGKKGIVVTTSKGNGEKNVAKYLKNALGQWGVNGVIMITENDKEKQLLSQDSADKKLDMLTNRFYRQLTSGRYISPTIKNIAVHNAFRAMALSGYAEFARDREFWQKDVGKRAYPVRAGWFPYAIGAFVFYAARGATNMLGKVYDRNRVRN